MRASILALIAGFVFAAAASAVAAPISAGTLGSQRPHRLNPAAVIKYLAEQRAGYGSPRHAALLAAGADAQARALRSRPIPTPPGLPNLSGPWTALGPAPVNPSFYGGPNTGRANSAAVAPNGTIFVGTAGGGVWASTDNGASWAQHTDTVSAGLAIGAITVDPTNSSIIYAGTGEANNCGDCFYGGGVLKSIDGGNSWTVQNPGSVFTGVDFTSIKVDPNNHNTVFAGTTSGFYVSSDGGATWGHPTGTGDFTHTTTSIALDPTTNPTTVYLATRVAGVQKSADGGTNFATLGGGLPTSDYFFTALGIGSGSTGHNTLYASIYTGGATNATAMYKTTDGGTSWSHILTPAYTNQSYAYGSGTADQGWYDNAVAVDPGNPNHVIAAGIAAVEVTDGGSTTSSSDWSNVNGKNFFAPGTNVVHPDFHAVTFSSAGTALLGCDGGVYKYVGGGSSGVSNLNTNQNTTQAYEDLAADNNGAQVLAGLQDNGTTLFTGSATWPDVLAGDGGYNAINPLDAAQQFGEADMRLIMTTDTWSTPAVDITPASAGGNFVPPMTIVPNSSLPDSPTVYYGGDDLWRTTNPTGGPPTWTRLTAVGARVSAIAVAPSNPAVVYVGFDNGTLEVSTNATSLTPSFTDISSPSPNWVTHIEVDPSNPGSIAITFSSSNTHTRSVSPMVETASVDLGTPSATYTDITGDLPTGVASNSVVNDGGTLVVATDVGVFMTTSPSGGSTHWAAAGTGLPNVQVIGLTVDRNGDVFAATHGRGVWKLNASQHTLSVSPTGSGSGSVSSNPAGISCPPTCSASFAAGSSVTLTANPAAGSTFTGWSGGGCSGTGTCTVTMNSDQAVTATFTANPPPLHTLNVSLAGTGSGSVTGSGISCPGTCSHSYTAGTQVTLTSTPASGSRFAGWSGGGCSGTGTCTVAMGSDQSVTAAFNSTTSAPSCVLTHQGRAVFVGPKKGHRKKRKHPKKGVLKLTARCNQQVNLALTGTFKVKKKRKKQFKISVVLFSSVGAGNSKTLNVKVPKRVLAALNARARVSATFVVVGTNGNGSAPGDTTINRLKATRW